MVGKKSKWYVVWSGLNPGVYDDWADCKLQIEGFSGLNTALTPVGKKHYRLLTWGIEPLCKKCAERPKKKPQDTVMAPYGKASRLMPLAVATREQWSTEGSSRGVKS